MKRKALNILLALVILTVFSVCAIIPLPHAQSGAEIRVHYLGHSAFIFAFDNGESILTDYGQSRAYDLDSPIYELGDFQPTIVIYSHHHPDHDRGMIFPNARLLDGKNLSTKSLDIKAIPVSENREGDNYGYLIAYKGYTIFHAGDSQGDIVNLSSSDEVKTRLRSQLPEKIDLLLVPIDWTRNIIAQAIDYIDFLQPRQVIPMHYWAPSIKNEFLLELNSRGKSYEIVAVEGPEYRVNISKPAALPKQMISLAPGPYRN